MGGGEKFLGFLFFLFLVRELNEFERIVVIVLPRNFIGSFLVMAEWVNEDFLWVLLFFG